MSLIYIYIYIYTTIKHCKHYKISLSLSLYIYIYIHTHTTWQHIIEGLRLPQAVHLDLAVLEAERVVDGEVAAACNKLQT